MSTISYIPTEQIFDLLRENSTSFLQQNDNDNDNNQFVTKRNGELEVVDRRKIFQRIKNTIDHKPKLDIDANALTDLVVIKLEQKMLTSELDEETCRSCIHKSMEHPDFSELASRIIISNHIKNTGGRTSLFSNTTQLLYNRTTSTGKAWPAINRAYYEFIMANKATLDTIIHTERNYRLNYFGFKTLEAKYLLRGNDHKVIERPGEMYLRIAVAIHMERDSIKLETPTKQTISQIKNTYNALSLGQYSHASPTLYNSGTNKEQFASCFLLGIGDSNREIMGALQEAAVISSSSGGVGMHWSRIRSRGAPIGKSGGVSSGPLPFLKIGNETMKAFNQGGRRPGSMAVFIEPWHADIFEIINARRPHIEENMRAKELFYAVWTPDLFMRQVESNGDWWLMCPAECPGLCDVYGDEFDNLYMNYVKQNLFKKKIKAHELWREMLHLLTETGNPFIGFKDEVNRKSNQKNLGTINSSNLCMEIMEYSDTEQHAVCTLSSVCVGDFLVPAELFNTSSWEEYEKIAPKGKLKDITSMFDPYAITDYIKTTNRLYSKEEFDIAYKTKQMLDHNSLFIVCNMIVENLNKLIDANEYPNKQTKLSNMLHRPLGIGIQGLADLFIKMKLPFESADARVINKILFETLYVATLWASNVLARKQTKYNIINKIKVINDEYYNYLYTYTDYGDYVDLDYIEGDYDNGTRWDDYLPGWYPSFKYNGGSPYSKGIMQYHMWSKTASDLSPRWNWIAMEKRIVEHGLRNSQLLACMPTASTSQILGNHECIEPWPTNVYTRKTVAGEHVVANKYLIADLHKNGLLTPQIIDNIIQNRGSAKFIGEVIGDDVSKINLDLYTIAWEMSMMTCINLAADRGPFIDQSQSMNMFMQTPTDNKLSHMLRTCWKKGLKTGVYYLRTRAVISTQGHYKSTVEKEKKELVDTSDKKLDKLSKVKLFECDSTVCTVCT